MVSQTRRNSRKAQNNSIKLHNKQDDNSTKRERDVICENVPSVSVMQAFRMDEARMERLGSAGKAITDDEIDNDRQPGILFKCQSQIASTDLLICFSFSFPALLGFVF